MSGSSPTQLELEYTQRLLVCFIFEINAHLLGEDDPPKDI